MTILQPLRRSLRGGIPYLIIKARKMATQFIDIPRLSAYNYQERGEPLFFVRLRPEKGFQQAERLSRFVNYNQEVRKCPSN